MDESDHRPEERGGDGKFIRRLPGRTIEGPGNCNLRFVGPEPLEERGPARRGHRPGCADESSPNRIENVTETPPAAPVAQIRGGIGFPFLPARDQREQREDPGQQRAALAASAVEDGLPHLARDPRRIDQAQRTLHGLCGCFLPVLGSQQWHGRGPWPQTGGAGDDLDFGGCISGEFAGHDRLAIGRPGQLGSEGVDTGAINRRHHDDRRRINSGRSQPPPEIVHQHPLLFGVEAI